MANVINSLKLGDGTYVFTTPYATCNTAAATAAKVATITPGSNFSLEKGARVAVQFDNANTAGSPTLNVNNTGAKAIYFKNAALTSSNYWSAKQIIDFIYDGNYWVCSAVVTDNNTDTKNTAGSTNTSNKIYLIGATSQAANPATYSHDTAYVGTDGCLYSNSKKVATVGDNNTFTGDNTFDGNNTLFTAKSYFGYKTYLGTPEDNVAELSFKDGTIDYPTPEKAYIRTVIQAGAEYNGRPTIDFVNTEGGSNRDMISLTKWDKSNEHYYRTALENAVSSDPGNTGRHSAAISHYELDVDTGAPTNQYRAKFPLKSGTVAFTSDIDVTAAGNNTFTGVNRFRKSQTTDTGESKTSEITVDPDPTNPLIRVGKTTGDMPNGEVNIGTDYMEVLDVLSELFTKINLDGIEVYNSNNSTSYKSGAIINGANHTLTIPDKSGTIALTSDIDVTAAGNNTFTGINNIFTNQVDLQGLVRIGKENSITILSSTSTGLINVNLPSKAGTLALTDDIPDTSNFVTLSGAQTISGNKTFTGHNIFTGTNTFKTETSDNLYRTLINLDGVSVGTGPRSSIAADTTYGYNDIKRLNTSNSYTYTFPSKSGVFALTSDIPDTSNFVTLSGAQTISGNKTFNNHISLHQGPDGYIEFGNWKFFGYSLSNNAISTSLSFPSGKNGTVAITDDIPIKTATLSGTTLSITLS
ncbi:hypothetical protein [Intestinibacter sp.]|uniref:hypothetical protein n=1 Tax=Intestinibacter sp. TaxID=1965304 RepID=UPI002A74A492|nr:hypothetical protein [Intestinibacter sp.]MDY2734773.1 hypothetical protein [Intestinibacter sp.]